MGRNHWLWQSILYKMAATISPIPHALVQCDLAIKRGTLWCLDQQNMAEVELCQLHVRTLTGLAASTFCLLETSCHIRRDHHETAML